jgi:SIR2-like domain
MRNKRSRHVVSPGGRTHGLAEHTHPQCNRSQCEICGNNRAFDLPRQLYDAVVAGDVVLFAGAGVSTEGRPVAVPSLYEQVCNDLKLNPKEGVPFPDVMTRYCSELGGRGALLRLIKSHFDYFSSFPELYKVATRFHCELATIWRLENIITTNWDTFFEDECAAIPFVSAKDFAFWTLRGRKVFKIHGSISSLGSMVITRQDYKTCYARLSKGLLGSSMKMALATKTILFAGFSFGDDDFFRIHRFLMKEMDGTTPSAYVITLDEASDTRFRSLGLNPIYTDAAYFLSQLKKKLIEDDLMVPDRNFDGLPKFLLDVVDAHDRALSFDAKRFPDLLYCWAYQDGLMHAIERILALGKSGYYSHQCNAVNAARTYQFHLRPTKLRAKQYGEVAYIDGYVAGHLYFLGDEKFRRLTPRYYVYGCDELILSINELRVALRRLRNSHSRAHALASRIIGGIPKGMTLHHPPVL